MTVKAMTFNIQHAQDFLHGEICPELMANTIRAFAPDFCVLNEVYGTGSGEIFYGDQAAIIADLAGMGYHAFCPAIIYRGNPYGNAIISKNPILSCKTVPVPEPLPHRFPEHYENRAVLVADFGDYLVIGSHFGLHSDEQENAVQTVLSELEKAEKPVILCGDFNMSPENPTLAPIFAHLHDTASAFMCPSLSFPSDKPKVKIDYIFASREFKIRSAEIPPVIASDHRPHIAELELQ